MNTSNDEKFLEGKEIKHSKENNKRYNLEGIIGTLF